MDERQRAISGPMHEKPASLMAIHGLGQRTSAAAIHGSFTVLRPPSVPSTMKHVFALLCFALLVAYATTSPAKDVSCDAPQGIPQAKLLLFGELHGSVESPALVGKVVCAYAEAGPVALGLEMPPTELPPIQNYLASNGGAAAKARLLSGPFWRGADGRSSRAMFDLVEHVRRLKRQGLSVSVFTLVHAGIRSTASDNEAIAQAIRTFYSKHPTLRIVVLMGNLHAGQAKLHMFGETIIPAGYLLRDLRPTSVLIAHHAGTIWACMDTCGVHDIGGRRHPSRKPGFYHDSPMQGYSMSYMLPSITASPPAGLAAAK